MRRTIRWNAYHHKMPSFEKELNLLHVWAVSWIHITSGCIKGIINLGLFPVSPSLFQHLLKPNLLLYSLINSLIRSKIHVDLLKTGFAVNDFTLLNLFFSNIKIWTKNPLKKIKWMGHSENRTRDLSHPKRESYH